MEISLTRTYNDQTHKNCEQIPFSIDTDGGYNLVNLYPEVCFEEFEGFGGAITDSSAYVYSLMPENLKEELINTYFSPDEMAYNIVRIHMDSCDFSTEMYEAMSDPDDTELKSFDFSRTEKYIIPMLKDAEKKAGKKLEIMLSPWSPPVFMKTNDSRIRGGSLKPEYAPMWAEYICRYIKEFLDRGFLVNRISIQNEPRARMPWDSCVYTPQEEKAFLEEHLYPAMVRNGLENIEVFIWDHNKDYAFERTAEIVSGKARDMVSGVACHWYSGDHFETMALIRKLYPNLKITMSESCIEYSRFKTENEFYKTARLSHDIIGDFNHGVSSFYDWNMLLDEKGGPNHAGNFCQAPFMYDTEKKELIPQLIHNHFYHFSHFIKKGAFRIGYSKYTEKFEITAFKNPNGTIAVVLLNRTEETLPARVRIGDNVVDFNVGPKEICTGLITL